VDDILYMFMSEDIFTRLCTCLLNHGKLRKFNILFVIWRMD